MRQKDPEFGVQHDAEAVARVLGLPINNIDTTVPIETVSTGMPFTIVPIKTLAALQNLRIDLHTGTEYLEKTKGKFFYFVSRETVSADARLHARMLFYNGEDPATGSAAGCTVAWMAAHGIAASNERVLIEQGMEMKRPSEIFVRADREAGRVVNVRVGGSAARRSHALALRCAQTPQPARHSRQCTIVCGTKVALTAPLLCKLLAAVYDSPHTESANDSYPRGNE
jgi:trans-2,3-dihydro-3-hydroxyanthranilate isomerase